MPEKTDGKTWEEYATFVDVMAEQSRQAIQSSELDADRYRIDERRERGVVYVWSDGWEMEVEDVVRLRDVLRDCGVGDESVAVVCNSRGPNKDVHRGELPSGVPRGVTVELWSDVKRGDETLEMIRGSLDEELVEPQ